MEPIMIWTIATLRNYFTNLKTNNTAVRRNLQYNYGQRAALIQRDLKDNTNHLITNDVQFYNLTPNTSMRTH